MSIGKEEFAESIDADRLLTHAVVVVDEMLDNQALVEMTISSAMRRLNDRAMRAGMVILNTVISQSAYYDRQESCGRVVLTVISQWMERSALEKMQLQQRLMGPQNGGR